MFNPLHCDDDQQRILDSTQYFLLSPEEQVNFHFMMHSRHKLKSPDFMASYESSLHRKKLEQLQAHCPDLSSTDHSKTFMKMKEYDLSNASPAEFQKLINDPENLPIV